MKGYFLVIPPLSRGTHVLRAYDEFQVMNFQAGITYDQLLDQITGLLGIRERCHQGQVIHPATFLIALGMFAAVVSMILDVGMPGLQQRAFLSLLLLWLSIVVHSLVRVTAGLVQQPYRPTT